MLEAWYWLDAWKLWLLTWELRCLSYELVLAAFKVLDEMLLKRKSLTIMCLCSILMMKTNIDTILNWLWFMRWFPWDAWNKNYLLFYIGNLGCYEVLWYSWEINFMEIIIQGFIIYYVLILVNLRGKFIKACIFM